MIKYELNTQNNKFKTYNQKQKSNLYSKGFTIVELLVVIVVIGILAAITIVSYTGISQKAIASSLQSDLTNSANKLKMYQVEYGSYPSVMSNNCPTSPVSDTKYCLVSSPSSNLTYIPAFGSSSPQTYSLSNTNGTTNYYITNDSAPIEGIETVTIGTQVWMKYNLNVGTRIDGATNQADNGVVEKYCYNNLESNCTTYGGLYQWNEAMQYSTSEGIQGIAPAGFHIPTDAEWTTLTTFLGGESVAGDKMKNTGLCQGRTPCATSGYGGVLGGLSIEGSFVYLDSRNFNWSSSQYDSGSSYSAYERSLRPTELKVGRAALDMGIGFSVRCIKN